MKSYQRKRVNLHSSQHNKLYTYPKDNFRIKTDRKMLDLIFNTGYVLEGFDLLIRLLNDGNYLITCKEKT